ncbi:MAG: SRPBCC family protein [Phenylobacterium sp.]
MACAPPPGFVDTPHPEIIPGAAMVAHTEQILVQGRPQDVIARVDAAPLEAVLPKTRDLPGVIGTHDLTPPPFHAPGSRRIVCLSDGAQAVEQVLERDPLQFRYVVWNYTTAAARPVDYAIGHFRYEDAGDGKTRIIWTYAFRLRSDRFPGVLGGLGRWLMKAAFLDRAYAVLMRETLAAMKRHAEA